jgi:hypothetical protein
MEHSVITKILTKYRHVVGGGGGEEKETRAK